MDNAIKTASTVFIHKSAKGALTLTFNDGDVAVTVFPEDIAPEAAAALKARLNPEVQVKKRDDGTERRYYMTRGKCLVTFRPTGSAIDPDTGRKSGTAYIESIEDAPNALEKFGLAF